MAGDLKVKFKHTIPVILHADLMEDFKKALNGQDVGVFFREIQEDVVDKYRTEKQKKGSPSPKGALINYIYNESRDKKVNKQTTLDIFAKVNEINEFIKEVNDTKLLGQMKRNAHQIEAVARTKLIKISKGLI